MIVNEPIIVALLTGLYFYNLRVFDNVFSLKLLKTSEMHHMTIFPGKFESWLRKNLESVAHFREHFYVTTTSQNTYCKIYDVME
jgi:hypothetical protein